MALEPSGMSQSYGTDNTISDRSLRALDAIDAMPSDIRECVHEFGYAIVDALTQLGIKKSSHIRHAVHTCWLGARQPGQRQGIHKKHSPVVEQLDWILLQSGSQITAAMLLRILDINNMVIVPKEPSTVMVEASMDAVKYMGTVNKETKHRNRLRVAIKAASERMWPHISEGTA